MNQTSGQCSRIAAFLQGSLQKIIEYYDQIVELLERISNYKKQSPVNYVELEQLMYHCQNALDNARNECIAIEQKFKDIQGKNLEIEQLLYQMCQYTFIFKEIIDNSRDLYKEIDVNLFDVRQFRQFKEKLKLYEYSAF